ncbi:MAG: zinc-binding dehydrogenase [Acidimicrobiales bacterium]
MRAVVIAGHQVTVCDRADPEPADHDLLVRVEAAGLNRADLLQVAGRYPPPNGVDPDIPGMDVAGEVIATGPAVEWFSPGDRVMGLVAGAAQAELALVDERAALKVPEQMSWAEAGGFPEIFCTAHDALVNQCELQKGERVLVSGAAGGVGVAAIQLALALGAEVVVATVRDEARRDEVAALGAEAVSPDQGFRRGPFDVVVELVGAPNVGEDLEALATGGRVAVIGVGGGSRTEIDLFVLMNRRARLMGSMLRPRSIAEKQSVIEGVARDVLPLIESGKVRVPVDSTFALSDADAAYRHFAEGGKFGKIVLVTHQSE